MVRSRQTLGFFLRLLPLYALLAAPWPWVQDAYAAAFRAAGNFAFGNFGSDGEVQFRPYEGGDPKRDTEILFRRPGHRMGGVLRNSSRLTGYLPTVEVVALVLATPIPWARRWRALLWGLVLVNAFVALRLEISLLYTWSGDNAWRLYDPSPFWRAVLGHAFHVTARSLTFAYVMPVFIWILVTFRRGDLERVTGWRATAARAGRRHS
jgi:hypothetical protein